MECGDSSHKINRVLTFVDGIPFHITCLAHEIADWPLLYALWRKQ